MIFQQGRRLSYAHRIMGSPGGKHGKSLQRNVWRGAVSPFKSSVFGQSMPHFAVIQISFYMGSWSLEK